MQQCNLPGSGSLIAWQWDFGDTASGPLNTSSLSNPNHEYPQEGGLFPVTLTVTNAAGSNTTGAVELKVVP